MSTAARAADPWETNAGRAAWGALWAVAIGFFMILVDTTIVSTAMPAIMRGLETGITGVVWVNSAYLLAFAVPLLVTGRLGDRYGPKNVYLAGLAVFTAASLWCGLSSSIGLLIAARVVQGLGAALMTPQTMTVITRMFPAERRGPAIGLWGAVAGIATLVGPVLGGVLVDTLGWEWIFFVNVPVGLLAFWRAMAKVPQLERHAHRIDWLGVVLSSVAMFLIVFGIQEGNTYDWGVIAGGVGVWHLLAAGLAVMVLFVLRQHYTRGDALIPLRLFHDRNFSLANVAITGMGLTVVSMSFPIVLYLQSVRGLTPTVSALMLAPMAVVSAALAPLAGRAVNRVDPKVMAVPGFMLLGGSIIAYGLLIGPGTPYWLLLLPPVIMGLGGAFIWPSVSFSATRNLGPADAGAGSGVYNTMRQVGSVLGSALIAALMESRIAAESTAAVVQHAQDAGVSPEALAARGADSALGHAVPDFLQGAFSSALGQSLLLPGLAAVAAGLVCLFFRKPSA